MVDGSVSIPSRVRDFPHLDHIRLLRGLVSTGEMFRQSVFTKTTQAPYREQLRHVTENDSGSLPKTTQERYREHLRFDKIGALLKTTQARYRERLRFVTENNSRTLPKTTQARYRKQLKRVTENNSGSITLARY
jgi:hypothetical protein